MFYFRLIIIGLLLPTNISVFVRCTHRHLMSQSNKKFNEIGTQMIVCFARNMKPFGMRIECDGIRFGNVIKKNGGEKNLEKAKWMKAKRMNHVVKL